MRLKITFLLCMIVLVGLSCGKSAKAKCKETYFAYQKDFPSVYDIEDTTTLNECLVRINEVLACADPNDFEYPLLEKDRLYLTKIKPRIIVETPRNYSKEQVKAYSEGLDLSSDSNRYLISTPYHIENLIKEGVTLDGTITYQVGSYPTIALDLRFGSHINGRTVDFVVLEQGTFTHREDHFILVNFEKLSDFSSDPYDYLLGNDPPFTYGTLHPGFETNDLFGELTAELPLKATWGNNSDSLTAIIPKEEVRELERLVNVFNRMRTGKP